MADQQCTIFGGDFYKSTKTGDKGFQFQEEILQYLSIRMLHFDYEDFSVGYEVKNIPKFDDVVVDFRNSRRNFTFAIQVKLLQNYTTEIRHSHLFEAEKTNISGRKEKKLWGKMNLKQYLRILAKFWTEKKVMKFILITNASLKDDMKKKMEDIESYRFCGGIFSKMSKKGAQIQRFGRALKEDFEKISPVENVNFEEFFEFVQENLIMVTNSLNLNELRDLNVSILQKHLKGTNNESCNIDETVKFVRESVLKHIEIDETSKERKVLKASDVKSILKNSFLETDLSNISREFQKRIPMKVEFEEEILDLLFQKTENENSFACSNFLEVNAFKVFRAIEKRENSVFIIRWSELEEGQKSDLKTWDKNKIVVILDAEESGEIPRENEKLIFVEKSKKNFQNSLTFSLEDLTEESEEDFLKTKIRFQNVEVELGRCFKDYLEKCENLLSKIFSKVFLGTDLNISDNIPDDNIQKVVYIDRKFEQIDTNRETKILSEKELLNNVNTILMNSSILKISIFDNFLRNTRGNQVIVKGDPGVGKSVTLQKMAIDFKTENPHFWVEFVELRKKTECLHEKFNSGSSEFTDEDEAKSFLFENFLNFGNDLELSRELIKFYLTLEDPPVFLVFDGFDEIMPHYEGLVVDFIRKLSSFKIGIFVSGRMHCEKVLRQLKKFREVTLSPYDDKDVKKFIAESLKDLPESEALVDFFETALSRLADAKSRKDVTRNSLFLNLVLKMFVEAYERNGKSLDNLALEDHLLNRAVLYEKLFEQSFNRSHEKTGADLTLPRTRMMLEKQMEDSREHHTRLAFKELNIEGVSCDYVSEDPLILERGFVSRRDFWGFYFVHRTFAEYFCAVELEKRLHSVDGKNKKEIWEMLLYKEQHFRIVMFNNSEIPNFIKQIVISKLKNGQWELPPISAAKEAKNLFDFLNEIYFHNLRWFQDGLSMSNIFKENLKYPLEFLFHFEFLTEHFNVEYFEENLLHFYLVIQSMEKVYGENAAKAFLKFLQIKYGPIPSSTETNDLYPLIKAKFGEENANEFGNKFGIFLPSWASQKMIQDVDFMDKVVKKIVENFKASHFDEYYKALFEKNEELSETFLSKFFEAVETRGQEESTSVFLELFRRSSIPSKVFSKKCCEILIKKPLFFWQYCQEIDNERKLLIKAIHSGYPVSMAFLDVNKMRNEEIKEMINEFSSEEIKEISQSPNFDSLLEYFKSEENGDFVSDFFFEFIDKIYGEEEVSKFIFPYEGSEKDISFTIRRNFQVYSFLALKNEAKDREKYARKFCEDLRPFDSEINFLREIFELSQHSTGLSSREKFLFLLLDEMKKIPSAKYGNLLMQKLNQGENEVFFQWLNRQIDFNKDNNKFLPQNLIQYLHESGYDLIHPNDNSIIHYKWRIENVKLFIFELYVKKYILNSVSLPQNKNLSHVKTVLRFSDLIDHEFLSEFFKFETHPGLDFTRGLVNSLIENKDYAELLCKSIEKELVIKEYFKEVLAGTAEVQDATLETLLSSHFESSRVICRSVFSVLNTLGCSFFFSDGTSILQHLLNQKDFDKVSEFLRFFPKERIKEHLVVLPFNWKSISELVQSREEFDESLIPFVFLVFYLSGDKSAYLKCLFTFDERLNRRKLLQRNFHILARLSRILIISWNFLQAVRLKEEKLIFDRIIAEVETFESLYEILELFRPFSKEHLENLIDIFAVLKTKEARKKTEHKNRLEEMFFVPDAKGNSQLHLYLLHWSFLHILDALMKFISLEPFVKAMTKQNSEERNCFHLISRKYEKFFKTEFLSFSSSKEVQEALKAHDVEGRTPLHAPFGTQFLPQISPDDKEFFCTHADEEGNNIFHHFAKQGKLNIRSQVCLTTFVEKSPPSLFETIKGALRVENEKNETPLEVKAETRSRSIGADKDMIYIQLLFFPLLKTKDKYLIFNFLDTVKDLNLV